MMNNVCLLSLAFFVTSAAVVWAECSQAALKLATDTYVEAQAAGNSTSFASLTSNLNYTENENAANLASGILATGMRIDHHRSIHDPVECSTFTEIISNSEKPYILGVRMLLTADRVSTMETLVTGPGDWLFNATGYLHWNSLETWDAIPVEKQDTRAKLKAAADAYFDRFANASVAVPYGTPCARLEGGAYTGASNISANTCGLGLPSTITVTNRRYVIDQGMGVVDMYLGFPGLDRSQGQKPMPDSHFFRIEAGQIRYIHTISSCVKAGCGL